MCRDQKKSRPRLFIKALFIVWLGLLTACSGTTSLTVKGDYPEPLVTPLPLTATLLLDSGFRDYVAKPNKKVIMAIGVAQADMIEKVLRQRFKALKVVSEKPATIDTDILIVPTVAGVQVGIPTETHMEIYEVWIKYSLEIFSGSDELVAKWFMPSYGKTHSAFMKSTASAINSAAQVALRDAGVRLITDLHRIPEFYNWINHQAKSKQREQDGV